MGDKVLHATRLEVFPALPAGLALGARVTRRVRLVCSFGCNLKGEQVSILDAEGNELAALTLTAFRDAKNESDEWNFTAPDEPASTVLTLAFDGCEGEAADHAASEAEVIIASGAGNATSLAVWGLPEPLIAGEAFRFRVGAKSSSGHSLAGCTIAVRDDKDTVVATAVLGEQPWAGTEDLHWVEVEAPAPPSPMRCSWAVQLDDLTALTVPHSGATVQFGFTAVPRPDSQLTVRVLNKEGGFGIAGAEIRIRAETAAGTVALFRGTTDEAGTAVVAAPSGRYRLVVWKPNYTIAPIEVVVGGDAEVALVADFTPKKKPEKIWM